MASLRAFAEHDIAQVAELYRRTFAGGTIGDPEGLRRYFTDVFFRNPSYDTSLPSLVYEEDDRKISGFLGVIPRRMVMAGRPIQLAVSTQFMVDPASLSSLAGLELVKAFLAGRQDVSLADGANGMSRKIWEALGGSSVPIYAFRWTRTLRRCEHALESVEPNGPWARFALSAVRPFCRLLDAVMCRVHESRSSGDRRLHEEPLQVETILGNLPRVCRRESFKPDYDRRSLEWLLDLASRKKKQGCLRGVALRDEIGQVVGWYLYYFHIGRTAHVLQFAAVPYAASSVLESFFSHLRREGATAVSGRVEPKFMHEFYHHSCTYAMGSAFLVHSKHAHLLQAIYAGDAFLSRLEGEWWNCFAEFAHERPEGAGVWSKRSRLSKSSAFRIRTAMDFNQAARWSKAAPVSSEEQR